MREAWKPAMPRSLGAKTMWTSRRFETARGDKPGRVLFPCFNLHPRSRGPDEPNKTDENAGVARDNLKLKVT